ncbi:hypothetical protein B5U98_27815 [Bosea sp. Tri-39]|nr:hypothetical protein BLM15_29595 [Bosea sp. Tri-49]RXT16726.1 hypothetical protein B5U98_27815 [Bosea sp. Tri-39]RXT42353.1 hypothetical protein B5U99_00105 [Bosea sp. Tri-54]
MSLSYSDWGKIYPQSPNPELEMHRFFSLAVELVCLDRCLTACHELRVDGAVSLMPSEEHAIVSAALNEFPALGAFSDQLSSFHGLARVARTIVREMNQACGRGNIAALNHRLPAREPGELLKFVTERLAEAISLTNDPHGGAIGFKFCLDDCEVLSSGQQKSLNTLVRISKHPVSWVVSSVGSFFDTSDTFIDQQPLTDHDRRIVPLDSRSSDEFRALCQAVLSLRLYFAVSQEAQTAYTGQIQEYFPLDTRLGKRNVNDLFASLIDESKSVYATRVEHAAKRLREALVQRFDRYRDKYPAESTGYPYYEAYVLLLWNGREDAFKVDFDRGDEERMLSLVDRFDNGSFEAWLRRKQAAALLHFAAKLGSRRLPLGGTPIIISLADGSVRDFLEIIGEIFESYCRRQRIDRGDTAALDYFASSRTRIGWPIQTRGIYSASASYLSGISNRSELDASVVTRFIDGLGLYTAALQSNPNDPSVLGRAERGIFSVRIPHIAGDDAKQQLDEELVWNVIRQAELAGYIRTQSVRFGAGAAKYVLDNDARIINFRLHRRFAPHFRFSYRGAYEPVSLAFEDVALLLDRVNQIDSKSWVQRMLNRPARPDFGEQLKFDLILAPEDD